MPISEDTLEAIAAIIEGFPSGMEARKAGMRTERLAKEELIQREFLRNLQESQLKLGERAQLLAEKRLEWEKTRVPESVQAARERTKGLVELARIEADARMEQATLEDVLGDLKPGTIEYEEAQARIEELKTRADNARLEWEMRSAAYETYLPAYEYYAIKEKAKWEPKTEKLRKKLEERERRKAGVKETTPPPPKAAPVKAEAGDLRTRQEKATAEIQALEPPAETWGDPRVIEILNRYNLEIAK